MVVYEFAHDMDRVRSFGKIISVSGIGLVGLCLAQSLNGAGIVNMATAYIWCFVGWLIACSFFLLAQISYGFPKTHKALTAFLVILLFSGGFTWLARYETQKRYELTHIIPDDLPTPAVPVTCLSYERYYNIQNAFKVFLGNTVVVFATVFPQTLIAIGDDDNGKPYPMLVVAKDGDSISIDLLRVFSDKSPIPITTFHQSQLWTDSNIQINRPDPHRLIVYGDQDREALNMSFLNPHALMITGYLQRNKTALDISATSVVTLPKRQELHHDCLNFHDMIDIFLDRDGDAHIGVPIY